MAKDKTKTGVPNKHLHARISFLQQAAMHLASRTSPVSVSKQRTEYINPKNERSSQLEPANPASDRRVEKTAALDTLEPGPSKALNFQQPSFGGLPLQLSSHLAQVARKSQIRLRHSVKHSICKRCNTPLIEGETCTRFMENLSKGGRKPQADVLIVECTACGATKRWHVGAKRQERKTKRKQESEETNGVAMR